MSNSERGGVSGEDVEGGDGEFLQSYSSPKGHNSSQLVGPGSPYIRKCDAGDIEFVMELKEEVDRLKKKIEMQSINLVESFESIFKVKDEECKKLAAENAELRRSLAALEEQVAEQAVHNVTQHLASVNVTNACVDECGLGNLVDVENGRDKCPNVQGGIMVDASPVAYVPLVDNNEMHGPIQADDSDVVVVSPMLTEGCSVVDGVNYFVRNIKGKVRKNLKLSRHEYPELRRRGRTMNNEVSLSKPSGVGSSVNVMQREGVVDVENVGDAKKILSEVLSDDQERLNLGKDFPENLYFFSSICWKNIVTDIQRRAMAANSFDQLVGTQDFDMIVESVAECPQQRVETMDCAIIVCVVMRQYVNHVDVGRSLEGGVDDVYDLSNIGNDTNTIVKHKAYATVLNTSESYVCGAIALAQSLLQTETKRDLIILLDNSISVPKREALAAAGWKIRVTKRIRNPRAAKISYNEYNYSKFRLWQLTNYDKIIFIDSNIVVLRSLDLLFHYP
ncbi:UDP-glucuronate:xylan alpha-glucuronosyltransferase 2 [Camellia lanceoleosa]|uniref:UDP-glucuronate:xylan alpha-glucuronosyltransferase 2 n=1 Tax=Camellia lanceoleosa TaxID=1840588 RepID=A0ACC0GSM3_9ERIC|nr:UDP-glucuronate:xylan alpha-glucuronosyltransferase 2 [Camellia lanceoleosa]